MENIYRVTPKKHGKKIRWIVQRCADRKTIKSFDLKSDAKAYELELMAKAPSTPQSGKTFHEAFKGFYEWKGGQAGPNTKLTKRSARRYEQEYRLRISKFMDSKVLLSNFKLVDMESYLTKAHDAGYPYKTLRKSVKDIKYFLRRMAAVGSNPCLDMLEFDISEFDYVVPQDHELRYEKDIEVIDEEEALSICNEYFRDAYNNRDSAYTFAILFLCLYFGLRASELQGVRRCRVDLEKGYLHIKGVWIAEEGGFLNRNKNKGSRRSLELGEDGYKFFDWWFKYLENNKLKHSKYLLPSHKNNDEPICYKYTNKLVWIALAKMGLAEIKVSRYGHVKVISSKFKGSPLKTFRHRFCTRMIDAMATNPLLTANYVKTCAGHTQFKTTQDRYGNHLLKTSTAERIKRTKAKEDALKIKLFSVNTVARKLLTK